MLRPNYQTKLFGELLASAIVQFDGLQVGDKNSYACNSQALNKAGRAGFEPANEDLAPLTA